jgi:hypothetical protein
MSKQPIQLLKLPMCRLWKPQKDTNQRQRNRAPKNKSYFPTQIRSIRINQRRHSNIHQNTKDILYRDPEPNSPTSKSRARDFCKEREFNRSNGAQVDESEDYYTYHLAIDGTSGAHVCRRDDVEGTYEEEENGENAHSNDSSGSTTGCVDEKPQADDAS